MSNILRPNLYGIGTTSTPEWIVSRGMVAKMTDAPGDQIIVIAQGGKLDLDGAIGANLIVLQGLASSQVSVFRSGTEVRFKLLSTSEIFLSLPATTTLQNLRFMDGDKGLQIVSGVPKFAGSTVITELTAPLLVSAGIVESELQLIFNEEMSGSGLPLPSAFQIAINGVGLAPAQYSVVSVEGDTVRVSLPASAATAASVSVSYVDPTMSNDARALQDINGNDVASFGPSAAIRNPADIRAPVLVAAATNTEGSRLVLEFSEDLAAGSLAVNRFTVSVAGQGVSVASASASGKLVELTLGSPAVTFGQTVQLSYTGDLESADGLRDTTGNVVANWMAWNVANEVLGEAPLLVKATNILRPNLFAIETVQTPNWRVSAGTVAKVTDASGAQLITVARGGKLDLDGALGANVVVLEGRASGDVEVYRTGTEVRFRLLESDETVLSMPATMAAQTLRFTNGDKSLQIVSGTPRFDGLAVSTDTVAPVCERVTIAGTDLRLVFDEELNGAKPPSANALKISANGHTLTAAQFTILGVEGKQLVVALAQAVADGAIVTVAYVDPTTANDDLAIQDINGNDSVSFGPIQVAAPVKKIHLDELVPAGSPGNVVSLSVESTAVYLVEDFARTSSVEVSGFGLNDIVELNNLPSPTALSISTEGSDVTLTVNAEGGVTSQLTFLDVVPDGVLVYNPASFNELAVGDLVGVDATRPVFSGGASREVSVVEGQAQLIAVAVTDVSSITFDLDGTDAALMQISPDGVVSLRTGVLDFDAQISKRTYSFNVVASDSFGNDSAQSITISVTNDPADDTMTAALSDQILVATSNTVIEDFFAPYVVSRSTPAHVDGFVSEQRVLSGVNNFEQMQEFSAETTAATPADLYINATFTSTVQDIMEGNTTANRVVTFFNSNGGVFAITDVASPNLLVMHEGDGSSGVSQTGFVLRNVPLDALDGFNGDNSIHLQDTTIKVTPDKHILSGTALPEAINEIAGIDKLEGRVGGDTLDFGTGVDSATFSVAFAAYMALIEAASIKITDKVAYRDGVDSLVSVERLVFSDGEFIVNADGTGVSVLNAQAAKVVDAVQSSGYADAVDGATFAFSPENMGDWLDGSAPVLVLQRASFNGDGDNQLVYSALFVAGVGADPGSTLLSMRYDMNPAVGAIQPGILLELTFPGDVRASLVPESLTYSG